MIRDNVAMFVTLYMCSLLIFVLRLKGPDIASNCEEDNILLENDTKKVFNKYSLFIALHYLNGAIQSFFSFYSVLINLHWLLKQQESQSSWANGWRRIRTLLQFLWPKNSIALQSRMLFWVSLLIAERFIDNLEPIYNQKIGNATNILASIP